MPRNQGFQVQNNFTAGLVSDNTLLNFPDNACTEVDNCVFDETGRVRRRFGFDFEPNYSGNNVEPAGLITSNYTWTEINGDGTQNLLVVQIGTILYFYDLSFPSLSQGKLASTVSLLDFDAPGATDVGTQACSFSQGLGFLFVAHPQCDPFYVTYASSAVTGTVITVKIRDLEGLDDSLGVDERPTATVASLSVAHKYNLYNQGWYYNAAGHLTSWDTALPTMPSNADIWWFYRTSAYVFDTALVATRTLGNTPAPKGYYVLSAFSEDRSTASGITTIAVVSTGAKRPSSSAFFAGRVWYAGTAYAGFSNKIFFSQVLSDVAQAGYCYQHNDPTAEDLNDLLPNDGGYIVIQGAGTVYAMREMEHSIIIFTSNGVWAVSGSSGTGFLATDFAVQKISSVPCTNATSIVEVDGSYMWWNDEGIWTIGANPEGAARQQDPNYNTLPTQNLFTITSLTNHKIRRYLATVMPSISRKQSTGAYNASDKVVYWLFSTAQSTTPDEITDYNKMLCYNLLSKAFYVWTIPNTNVKLRGILVFKGFAGANISYDVIDASANLVIDADTNQVISYNLTGSSEQATNKYIVSYVDGSSDTQFTIATNVDTLYLDWAAYDTFGVSFDSYFITGYMIPGDGMRFFQPNYVQLFLEQETGAGGKIQGIFDWTSSTDSNRWSGLQNIYNTTWTNRVANFRRLKIRGKGKSIQLRVESEINKPFTIVGWGVKLVGNADL